MSLSPRGAARRGRRRALVDGQADLLWAMGIAGWSWTSRSTSISRAASRPARVRWPSTWSLDDKRNPLLPEEKLGPVSAETSRRLACDASVVRMSHDTSGAPLDVGRKTRTIPPSVRRALAARDTGCRFPACTSRRCDAHHIEHWSMAEPRALATSSCSAGATIGPYTKAASVSPCRQTAPSRSIDRTARSSPWPQRRRSSITHGMTIYPKTSTRFQSGTARAWTSAGRSTWCATAMPH